MRGYQRPFNNCPEGAKCDSPGQRLTLTHNYPEELLGLKRLAP